MEQWAELRREHFVRGVSIKALVSRTGLSRNTVRAALRAPQPPKYQRAPTGSKLDPFKDEIHRLLKDEPTMAGQRIRELIVPLGFEGGKTIVVDARTYQRTVYRPGEICQYGSPRSRFRSATARLARDGSWWRAWANLA